MLKFWTANLRRQRKKIIIETLIWDVILFIVLMAYKWNKAFFFKVVSMIKSMPEEIYVLLGISQDTETGNFAFYIFYIAMVMLFWFVWKAVSDTINLARENEQSGRMYRLCNQLYDRNQMSWLLYIGALIQIYVRFMVWAVSLGIMLLIGGGNQTQRINGLAVWSRMIGMGVPVVAVYVTIGYLYAAIKKKHKDSEGFCYLIVLVPWLAANSYKIIGLVNIGAEYLKRDISSWRLGTIKRLLEKLYWICPLSWCGPFTQTSGIILVGQVFICIILSGTILLCSKYVLQKRDYFLP